MKYFSKKPKIILVPYPAQGHVTPMLTLASAFHSRGFFPILITPNYIHRKIESSDEVRFISIPDGLDDDMPRDFFTIETAMETVMPGHLRRVLADLGSEENGGGDGGIVCMVVDLLASWAIEVGKECGVAVAGFWPAMLATYELISAIPEMVRNGLISDTGIPKLRSIQCVPNQPPLSADELPWLIGTLSARKARFKFWTRTLSRSNSLPWILFNSFPQKPKINNSPFFLIGPLIRHSNLPQKNPSSSFFEEDRTSLQWLQTQTPNSVIYISFGTWVSPITESKVKDLAMALLALRKPFIWVLKSDWRNGLPVDFVEKVSSFGKVVSWAPQMEILNHGAVGCYLTHCGWNSIMEAIQCRKRMLCFPVAGDQFLNCGFVVEVWRIGVRVYGFGEKEVEDGVRKVMEDGEMEKRMMKMYECIMGEEANSRVKSSFVAFIDGVMLRSCNLKNCHTIDYKDLTGRLVRGFA